MALRAKFNRRFQGTMLTSGKVYKFAYSAYQHDPTPLIIFLYWMEGTHPTTKRQWRFIQAINLNYVGRSYRQQFVENWKESLYRTRDIRLTWETVKSRWPELAFATRRYFYSPGYYIKGLRLIPEENVQQEVVGSLAADYSNRKRISRWSRLKQLQNILPSRTRRR